jgi:hypothetical protein
MSELMIKGQVFEMRTLHDLVLMVVRLRYENGLDDKIRRKIILAGQKYGLLSETEEDSPYRGHRRGPRPTSKYFALMSDEAEQLARELTGQIKLCACGCGRKAKLGEFALKGCRFARRSKKVRDRQKQPEMPAISLGNFDTFSA